MYGPQFNTILTVLPLEDKTEHELPSSRFVGPNNPPQGCDLCDQAVSPLLCSKHITVTCVFWKHCNNLLTKGFDWFPENTCHPFMCETIGHSFVEQYRRAVGGEQIPDRRKSRRNDEEQDGGSDIQPKQWIEGANKQAKANDDNDAVSSIFSSLSGPNYSWSQCSVLPDIQLVVLPEMKSDNTR